MARQSGKRKQSNPDVSGATSALPPERALELFKFYDGAAEMAKGRAWSLTTWILALNAGLFAFAFDFFSKNRTIPAFPAIETASALVGVGLCVFLIYMLLETGRYIRNYHTHSNKIAANDPPLEPFIGSKEAKKVRCLGDSYKANFPWFCVALAALAGLFAIAHVGAAYLLLTYAAVG